MPGYIAGAECSDAFYYIGLKTDIRPKPNYQNRFWEYRYVFNVTTRRLIDNLSSVSQFNPSDQSSVSQITASMNGGDTFVIEPFTGMGSFYLTSQQLSPFNDGGCEQFEVFENWVSVSYNSEDPKKNGWNDLSWDAISFSSTPSYVTTETPTGDSLDYANEILEVGYRDETTNLEQWKKSWDVSISATVSNLTGVLGGDYSTLPWGVPEIQNVSTNGGSVINLTSGAGSFIGTAFEITPIDKQGGKLASCRWQYRTSGGLNEKKWE